MSKVVFKPTIGTPAKYVLATYRQFPSLEPVRFQPVASSILSLPLRRDILWRAVVYERDAERVGSKHIKNRAEMGYSGKKLRPQKGSGRARMGDRGSPMRHDGGRAFGRQPGFDWSTGLPFQAYALAMRTALSYQYQRGALLVVEDQADFVSGHTRAGTMFMKEHDFTNTTVGVLVDQFRQNLHEATHKKYGQRVEIISKNAVTVRDILKPSRLIVEASVLEHLAKVYGPRRNRSEKV